MLKLICEEKQTCHYTHVECFVWGVNGVEVDTTYTENLNETLATIIGSDGMAIADVGIMPGRCHLELAQAVDALFSFFSGEKSQPLEGSLYVETWD